MIVLNIIGHFASEFDSILFQNHIYIYIYILQGLSKK